MKLFASTLFLVTTCGVSTLYYGCNFLTLAFGVCNYDVISLFSLLLSNTPCIEKVKLVDNKISFLTFSKKKKKNLTEET